MSTPENRMRKDLASTYRKSSSLPGERVPDSLRQAIFEAAQRGIEVQPEASVMAQVCAGNVAGTSASSAGKPAGLAGLLGAIRDRFMGPWPYAAATAMLAVLAVTVAVRVEPEASKQEREPQAPVPALAFPAAEESAARVPVPPSSAPASASTSDSAPAPSAGVPGKSESAPAIAAAPVVSEKEQKARAAAPAKANEAGGGQAARSRSEMSSTEASGGADHAAKSRPDSHQPGHVAPAMEAGRQMPQDLLAPLMARLVPAQRRGVTLSILAEAGAVALPAAQRSGVARSAPPPVAASAPASAPTSSAPSQERSSGMADSAAVGVGESESRDAAPTRAMRNNEVPRDYEQSFRLPDNRRLTCHFRASETGGEDLLVRCVAGQ